MQVRGISYLVHGHYKFYAQNVSLIPIYNKIFVDSRSKLKPDGFDGKDCYIDPDLPIYRNQWIQYNAEALCYAYQLDNLVIMNGGSINISNKDWMEMDMFLREAHSLAYNKYAKEENKKQSQMKADLEQKMESAKEYKSSFSGITKPTFID